MKIKQMLFLTIFVIILFSLFSFEDTYGNWKRRKAIEVQGGNKYKAFFLDDEVYKYASAKYSDLRIVNSSNQFVPFIFVKGNFYTEAHQKIITQTRLINKTIHYNKETKQPQLYIYDYQVLAYKSDQSYNFINCTIGNESYTNLVQVFGKTDKTDWNFITQDTIYSVEKFKKTDIAFDYEQTYKYYRIILRESASMPDIKSISLISILNDTRHKSLSKTIDLEFMQKEVGTQSIIEIKNPNRLPLYHLSINSNGNYKREYHVEDLKHETIYKTGYIYSYQMDDIRINENKVFFHFDYIKDESFFLLIKNNTEMPLVINSITSMVYYDQIVFESDNVSHYKLLYDNQSATFPQYTMEENKESIITENKDMCSLSAISSLNEKISSPFFKAKYIIRALLLTMAIAIIFFIVVFIRAKTT